MISLGGNKVKQNFKIRPGENNLENNSFYKYRIFKLNNSKNLFFPKNKEFTLFLFKVAKPTYIIIKNKKYKVSNGDSFNIKNYEKVIIHTKKSIFFSINSTKKSLKNEIVKTRYNNHYKVNKPWGYELWVTGNKRSYAFKEIKIKKGFQTSLQFHRKKRETNFLFQGKARLIYKKKPNVKNMLIKTCDLGKKDMKNYAVINVTPNIVHRIKALSDIKLFETSTPELDDVVRIMDDSNRKDGKILSEHKKK